MGKISPMYAQDRCEVLLVTHIFRCYVYLKPTNQTNLGAGEVAQ